MTQIMEQYFFTIFTPTYNRAYKIKDLYQSLLKQTYKNFEWLIVDNGSTDNTKELINQFINDGLINIKYILKKNEGKQIAINCGSEYAKGKFFFIVDSDDVLTENALEISFYYCNQIISMENYAGVVGLRGDSKKNIWNTANIKNGNKMVKSIINDCDYVDATTIQYRFKMKISGDRAEIIKTDILRKYKFPKFEGETYISDGYLWLSLGRDGYMFRWFNSIIYITEYLEDGLTRNGKEIARKNPKSKSLVDNFMCSFKEVSLKIRLIHCINYYRYGIYGKIGIRKLIKQSKSKILSLIALPIAIILRIK